MPPITFVMNWMEVTVFLFVLFVIIIIPFMFTVCPRGMAVIIDVMTSIHAVGVNLLSFSVRRFCNTRNKKNETSSHPSIIREHHTTCMGGMGSRYTSWEKQPSAFHLVTLNFADSLAGWSSTALLYVCQRTSSDDRCKDNDYWAKNKKKRRFFCLSMAASLEKDWRRWVKERLVASWLLFTALQK